MKKLLKLYLLTQDEEIGYDTFDSCIVAAKDENEAKQYHPSGRLNDREDNWGDWPTNKDVITCIEIGKANKEQQVGVIIASFNAG
jgi:hypothetical protein